MAEEHVFSVDGASAIPARRISLTDAGLLERDHLQEWVIAHPQILGEDLLIVTFEFDRWLTGAGAPTWERLDVLALDQTGRLVVAELKRDKAPDTVMVQALNYAAMVRRFNLDLLAEAYATRKGADATLDDALAELREWAPALSDESMAPPRIVLVAEEFGSVMTNTAMFLIESGLELRLVRVQLYELADKTLALTASQLLPVPDVEEFMVRPRSTAQTQRATRAAAARRASIPTRLIAAGVLPDKERLTIVVPGGVAEDREAIERWLDAEDTRSEVSWTNDPQTPVVWAVDNRGWNITTLIRHIIEQATAADPQTQVWGPNWYRTADGTVLYKLAEGLDDPTGATGFDWTRLHQLLNAIPAGRWTTYGDLAAVVGTAAQPLGGHLANCGECPNAWRVLGSDGHSRPNFRRSDPGDQSTQEDVLSAEGVRFLQGVADKSARLTVVELKALTQAGSST